VSLVLADTSSWARIHQPSVARLLAATATARMLTIVTPVILELLRSARSFPELVRHAQDLDTLHLVELTSEMSQRAREVQAVLARRGHHRGPTPVDLLAAAAAEAVGAELWHCDRHFELIAAITGQAVRKVGH
jgi:predicted nucleic acid-binding protein